MRVCQAEGSSAMQFRQIEFGANLARWRAPARSGQERLWSDTMLREDPFRPTLERRASDRHARYVRK